MLIQWYEFIRLRYSDDPSEYRRAASEPAALEVWLEFIEQHPDSRVWVARNKTVPVEVLSILAGDPSPDVRFAVSTKKKLTPELLERWPTILTSQSDCRWRDIRILQRGLSRDLGEMTGRTWLAWRQSDLATNPRRIVSPSVRVHDCGWRGTRCSHGA